MKNENEPMGRYDLQKVIENDLNNPSLTEEERVQLKAKFHQKLIDFMEGNYLPIYSIKVTNEARFYRKASQKNAISAIGAFGFTLVSSLVSIFTGQSLPLSLITGATASAGAAFLTRSIKKRSYVKNELNNYILVSFAWERARQSLEETLKFYEYNNLKIYLNPFKPLEIEYVEDNREELRLVCPYSLDEKKGICKKETKKSPAQEQE